LISFIFKSKNCQTITIKFHFLGYIRFKNLIGYSCISSSVKYQIISNEIIYLIFSFFSYIDLACTKLHISSVAKNEGSSSVYAINSISFFKSILFSQTNLASSNTHATHEALSSAHQ